MQSPDDVRGGDVVHAVKTQVAKLMAPEEQGLEERARQLLGAKVRRPTESDVCNARAMAEERDKGTVRHI
jgi:hypothetical protein